MARPLDTCFVTVAIHATCTLQIPAEDVEVAIQSAYNSPILSGHLYDIEKEVVRVIRLVETKRDVSFMVEKHSQK